MALRGRLQPRGPYQPDQRHLRIIGAEVAARGTPARIEPSQADAYGPEQGTYTRLPGSNFPPAGAIPVDPIGDANIAPAASAVLVTVNVPDTLRFRIAGIGFQSDDDIALGYLTWSIRLGPDPAPGYSQMLAAVGSVRQLSYLYVLVGSSQTVTVVATISPLAPITYRYICRLQGWYYSEKEIGH